MSNISQRDAITAISLFIWIFVVIILKLYLVAALLPIFMLIIPIVVIILNHSFELDDIDDSDILNKRDTLYMLIVSTSLLVAIFGGKDLVMRNYSNPVKLSTIFVTAIVFAAISSFHVALPLDRRAKLQIRLNMETIAVTLIVYALIVYFLYHEDKYGDDDIRKHFDK